MPAIVEIVFRYLITNINKNQEVQSNKVNEVHDFEDELNKLHDLPKVDLLSDKYVVFNHVAPFLLIIQRVTLLECYEEVYELI